MLCFLLRQAAPLGFVTLALAWVGCSTEPDHFVERLAEQECEFVARCTPVQFERRCRACRRQEDCKQGACDLRSGLCQDELGRPMPGKDHLERCEGPGSCGGYVCAPRYLDARGCIQDRRELRQDALERFSLHEQDPEQGCAFSADLAKECIRQNEIRACSALAPAACDLTLRDCS